MRSPFSQEAQYDLKVGDIIGFKGARIKVIEATNTALVYEVVNNFPGPVN